VSSQVSLPRVDGMVPLRLPISMDKSSSEDSACSSDGRVPFKLLSAAAPLMWWVSESQIEWDVSELGIWGDYLLTGPGT
jgi:hypothetical protein